MLQTLDCPKCGKEARGPLAWKARSPSGVVYHYIVFRHTSRDDAGKRRISKCYVKPAPLPLTAEAGGS